MDKVTVLLVVILILILCIFGLCIVTFIKVKNLQQGNCVGVPKFDPNSIYSKSMTVPIINYTITGTATFKTDNTFVLNFGGDNIYNDNKWIYNEETCSLTISLDPSLQGTLTKYNSSVNNTLQIDRKGRLILSSMIAGILPIQVTLDKN